MRITRCRIVVADLAASLVKRFRDGQADHAEPDDADDQAIESGKIV